MALTKKAKIWIIILSIPVALVVSAVIAAKLYFTSERLKALVIPRIEGATHRTVTVRDISLSVFPTLAVSIDNLKISNPVVFSFDRDEFIALDNLKLKVKILPLLASKMEIDYIVADHPVVYLEITKDGKKNYSSSSAMENGIATSTATSGNTRALLLSNLEINNGEIEQVDKKFDTHILIKGFHQTASVQARPGETTFFMNGATSIESFSYGSLKMWYLAGQPVTADETLSYNVNTDMLSLDAVTAKLRDLPLSIHGSISQLTQPELMVNMTVTSPVAEMAQLLSIIPPELLKKTRGLTSSGDVKFTMNVKGPSSETMNPDIDGSFTVTNGKVQYASLPRSITDINLAGRFEKPSAPVGKTGGGSFGIEKLGATIGNNNLNGALHVSNFSDPTVTATLAGTINLDEVKEFYPLEQGTELSGVVKANIEVRGKPGNPQTLRASGNINFQSVTIKTAESPKPLKNLDGTITFSNQFVESKRLTMNIGESDMNLSFSLKNYLSLIMSEAVKTSGKPSATVTMVSKQLRTVDLMAQEAPTKGKETGKEGTTGASGGMLPGIDINATVTVDKLQTEKFTFTDAKGTVGIAEGIVSLRNFAMNAFDGTIQSKGTLDLRDPKKSPFDLDLNIKNAESSVLLSNFTSFGQYLFGKISTTTSIKGDLNDTLGLNTQSLLGNGTVNIADGKLIGYPLTQKLADATNLTELRELNFRNWTNAFSISNGRLNVKDLKVSTGSTDFLVGGSQGLDGSLEYDLTVKLPSSVSDRLKLEGAGAELLQFFRDKDGRYSLSFAVSGMTANPVFRLDTRAQQEMAKYALEQKKQQLLDEGKKKAEDVLKKLFKKP